MNKIRNEKGEITTETKEIQRIFRKYCEQLSANRLDNLDKNGQIPRNIQSSKIKSGRIRESE